MPCFGQHHPLVRQPAAHGDDLYHAQPGVFELRLHALHGHALERALREPERARDLPHAVAEGIFVAIVGDDPAARHAAELAQHAAARFAVDVEQEADAHQAVGGLGPERQRLGIGAHVAGDVGVLHRRKLRGLLHHLHRDVAAHHLVARAREIAGETAGATGQIDDGFHAVGERQRLLDRVPLARVAALALRRAKAMFVVVGRDVGALIELLLVGVAVRFRLRRIVAGRLFCHRRNLTCRLRSARAKVVGRVGVEPTTY